MQHIPMQYFSRFPSFPRPWNPPTRMNPQGQHPAPKEDDQVPFIPPGIDWEADDPQEEESEEERPPFIPQPREVRTRTPPHRPVSVQRQRSQHFKTPPPPPRPRENRLIQLKAYKFRPSREEWKHSPTSGLNLDPAREAEADRKKPRHDKLRIITWNIDMVTPHHENRLYAALRHIEEVVLQCRDGEEPREACCIMLQEVHATILPFLLKDPWVRRWFEITPYTADKWPEGAVYGNVTLVSRSLDIAECHILHFAATNMERTALCVKVRLAVPGTHDKVVLSLVNTHLESLPVGAEARPQQLEMCNRFLTLRGVHGGVIAGDMNAIGPKDGGIAKHLGLKDSWRKGDDDDSGHTWGYQGQNGGKFPCNRLDKIFYMGRRGYKVDEPKQIGAGLRIVEGKDVLWVSDHYGLDTMLHMLRPRSASS